MSSLRNRITMYRRTGAGVNEFRAEIVKRGEGFIVNVAAGKHGSKLTSVVKTPKPVTRDRAQQIYGDLAFNKAMSGYERKFPKEIASAPRKKSPPPKQPTWNHPRLGVFKYDVGDGWFKILNVPAFKAFSHGSKPCSQCQMTFEADSETNVPAQAALAIADRFLTNQDVLVDRIVSALWNDIKGRGPDSGMFWHGEMDTVVEAIQEDFDVTTTRLEAGSDLLRLIQPHNIIVRKKVLYYEKPVIELCFSAAFDVEHGLGVLTDGQRIIGIGGSSDVVPFERFRTKRRGR